jgi:hypothetical protein
VQKKQKEMSSTDENWEGAERLRLNLPGEWIGRVGKVQLKAADPSAIIASVSGCPCAALPCTLKRASLPPGPDSTLAGRTLRLLRATDDDPNSIKKPPGYCIEAAFHVVIMI